MTARAEAASSGAADYGRAMLNILSDLTEEKEQMHEMQAAVLNLLSDAGEEKDRLATTQVAMLNILDDFDEEKQQRAHAEAQVRELNITLEQRVKSRTSQLEAANKDLEGFSYSVSHDLRTPLRAIDNFSALLLEQYSDRLDEEGQRLLKTVRRNADRLAQLIHDMLEFSRAGAREVTPARVDVTALARQTLDELLPAASPRRFDIRIGDLPAALADHAMLLQALRNLLSNAIKFTGGREVAVIEIRGLAGESENVYSIRDNGAGFNPAYSNKLFGVCQRLHGTDEFPGSGIGLAIVKRVINKLGGRVWADSAPDHGATFHFSLPRACSPPTEYRT